MPTADTAAPATAASAVTPLRARARRRVVGLEARSRRQKGIRYVFLAVSAAFMINAVVGDNGLLASMKAKRQSQEMQAALNALRVENQQLRNRANRLKNDPTAIEEEARKNLGLIRPGETLVIVKDAPASK
jgi:cell division protein FtsB